MKVKYNNQNISNTGSAHINTSLKTEQKKLKTKNRATRRKKMKHQAGVFPELR